MERDDEVVGEVTLMMLTKLALLLFAAVLAAVVVAVVLVVLVVVVVVLVANGMYVVEDVAPRAGVFVDDEVADVADVTEPGT